jgi:hypothetical protein
MPNPANELEVTVERVRSGHFPSLPAGLVSRILQIEAECVENRAEAVRRVTAAIQSVLGDEGA